MHKKEKAKEKIIEILGNENRSLSIRELTERLVASGAVVVSQPTVLNYLEELEKENKIVEVNKNCKKIQNSKFKDSSKKTFK